MFQDPLINKWQDVLAEAKHRLGHLTRNTEEEFLLIGGNLQNYYKSAKDITAISSAITVIISDKILKNGISELNILLHKIKEHFLSSASDIENGEASLYKIISVLKNVMDDLAGFRRIVKHLRMLGISTRIESARLGQDDAGFTALAENVENLSSVINDKAADIRHNADHLLMIINETISRIHALENKQHEQTGLTLNSINLNLSALNSKYNLCSEKTGVISSKTSEISKNISQIVSSIQFHDITRQQMEHVVLALDKLDEKIQVTRQYGESDPSGGNDQFKAFSQENIIYMHNICLLQSLQLKHTKSAFCNAVNSIVRSLDNVRNNVADVLAEAQNIASDGSKSNDSNIIKEIESGFSEISSSLNKNSEIRIELTNSMKSVVDTIKNLAIYINEIDGIGSEIELIALNSSIKAAHTGSQGAALGILADSIQRLSNDSKDQTKVVSETLRQISEVSEKLYLNIEYDADNCRAQGLKQIAGEISLQLENLTALDRDTYKQLSGIRNSFEKLDNEITISISKIDVHNETSEIIDSLTMGLDGIVNIISQNIDPELLNNQEELQELNYQYTMDSERNIHEMFIKEKLADSQSEKRSLANKDNTADEIFDDNIELF